MSRVIREDRIRNDHTIGSLDVITIIDKMRKNRLRESGHVRMRENCEIWNIRLLKWVLKEKEEDE